MERCKQARARTPINQTELNLSMTEFIPHSYSRWERENAVKGILRAEHNVSLSPVLERRREKDSLHLCMSLIASYWMSTARISVRAESDLPVEGMFEAAAEVFENFSLKPST